jgi:hypothetical protein
MRKVSAAATAVAGLRGGSQARGPELAATAALAAAITVLAAVLLPDAGAIDALACIKFYLAQGCVP